MHDKSHRYIFRTRSMRAPRACVIEEVGTSFAHTTRHSVPIPFRPLPSLPFPFFSIPSPFPFPLPSWVPSPLPCLAFTSPIPYPTPLPFPFPSLPFTSQPTRLHSGLIGSNESEVKTQATSQCAGPCPRGFYCKAGTWQLTACTPGHSCSIGTARPIPCPEGTYSSASNLKSEDQCLTCPKGSFCPARSLSPTLCSPGKYASVPGLPACEQCPAGTQQGGVGATSCPACDLGYSCWKGSSTAFPCEEGRFGNATDLKDAAECTMCPAGSACSIGSVVPRECLAGEYQDWAGQGTCKQCDRSAGHYQPGEGATSCLTCTPGFWCTASLAVACPKDTYNPNYGNTSQLACRLCPLNSTTNQRGGRTSVAGCMCKVGFYRPAAPAEPDSAVCRTCPSGSECPSPGITIGTLPVKRGYFRIANASKDVRRCPDAYANCSGSFECVDSSSGCRGSVHGERRCLRAPMSPRADSRHLVPPRATSCHLAPPRATSRHLAPLCPTLHLPCACSRLNVCGGLTPHVRPMRKTTGSR